MCKSWTRDRSIDDSDREFSVREKERKKTFIEIEIGMTRVPELILKKHAKSGQDWEGAIRA